MLNFNLAVPPGGELRILCLGAHSDDIEIGCGGTLLTLLDRFPQAAVRWLVFGAAGDRACEAEQSARAFLTGAQTSEVEVKAYRDGFFPFNGAQIKDEFEALKPFDPHLVFTHYRDDRHQDHRLLSDLTWNTFRNHLILEYEIPKYDGDLGTPNFFVPLPEPVCSRKVEAILASFPSQRRRQWFDRETFLSILRLRGMEANSPTRYAEAFFCRKVVLA
jgi:LmbE family N-acetylglucosaminyl deacetylase